MSAYQGHCRRHGRYTAISRGCPHCRYETSGEYRLAEKMAASMPVAVDGPHGGLADSVSWSVHDAPVPKPARLERMYDGQGYDNCLVESYDFIDSLPERNRAKVLEWVHADGPGSLDHWPTVVLSRLKPC